jgi:hypothetical protein
MNRLYVIMAALFVAVILASLWYGLSGVHIAKNATADSVTVGLGK